MLLNNSNKRKLSTTSKSTKNPSITTLLGTYDDITWPESNVLWGSLTLNLVKYGKEALRQRDLSLQTALDTLQEALSLERLIQCLRTYSELQVSKENDPKRVVDKFLDFHQELASATVEYQALARSSLIFPQPVSVSASNAKKDELEKRNRAVSWIIAALQSELSNIPRKTNIFTNSMCSPSADRKFQNSPSRQRKVTDTLPNRGICNFIATDLAKALHSECNRWFLGYIEKFLDSVRGNTSYTANDSQVASLLCLLKRVDEWLVTVGSKERTWSMNSSKGSIVIEDDDAEAYGRVRRKIYEILLRHVESAAMALENMRKIDEDSVVAR
ncbi:hypothetical protein HPP92_006067 [Vanilla planifolia]|uniref:DUF6857 domain-containing protein n=1 Tax=Vanilla planifolia TaxID=51239 RepID=A0A835V9N3_VANPL|nr:hypothetical protein HPP92_006067 [Vanilla planifolia]